jgi:phage-related protein
MKNVVFLGDSLAKLRNFPKEIRQDMGFQIEHVQLGKNPDHWKPMRSIGIGVKEIRIAGDRGQYRVIYIANRRSAVYVLHAFQKKSRKTAGSDIALARKRLKEIDESP